MGFPADKLEGVYRNPIDEVVRFLDQKHNNHYRIYNLCSERHYDWSKFHNRVAEYPFDDHNPPLLQSMRAFCEDVDQWLNEDIRNVAVIHCKAGKGRTGVMICAYMLHKGLALSSQSALDIYGEKRTHDNKGVTIPSQKRYVNYYHQLVKSQLTYRPIGIILFSIQLIQLKQTQDSNSNCQQLQKQQISTSSVTAANYVNLNSVLPLINNNKNTADLMTATSAAKDDATIAGQEHQQQPSTAAHTYFDIHQLNSHNKCEKIFGPVGIEHKFEPVYLCGDIKVEFFQQKTKIIKKEKLFQFWFNTYFASNGDLVFNKDDIDKASKETTRKLFGDEFAVMLRFKKAPINSVLS